MGSVVARGQVLSTNALQDFWCGLDVADLLRSVGFWVVRATCLGRVVVVNRCSEFSHELIDL